ncbi:U3 small nucleolar RNA-associated protein [Fasciolopsis buskii]|uniref:U3 small nucleolar RNA-associated protein n=1 Tax=Fasciolopsis buskii TaxID=27845 RepID=A0A8E0RPI1_9TREM|nr:U3 small nucleolar RNA-associated protein [Fasciolopsis buski]
MTSTFVTASGTVFMFDLRSKIHRMIHQWVDEASTGGASIGSSPDGHWIACGSDSGFVNVYSSSNVIQSVHPHPDKSIANLNSRANLITFHPSNEMLCIGSSKQPAAVRLYHIHGRRVFDNFPARVGRLGVASSVAFSPGGRYMCVGQKSGRASLYAIGHYPTY